MLRQASTGEPVQKWMGRLHPIIEGAQATLRQVKPSKLMLRSGCEQDEEGNFRLTFFWQEYLVIPPHFSVRRADTGREPSPFTQSLLLTYLATADGTTPAGRWVAFRELPDGMFYAQAFRGYAEDRLARELGDSLDAFRRGAEALGGEGLGIGDAGYRFTILPRIQLAAVYWLGDEDFPSRASILFDERAAHYMPTDGLAILGSRLVDHILAAVAEDLP